MMNYKDMEKIKNFNEKTPTKEWERNNPNISIDINQPIPDYTNIK